MCFAAAVTLCHTSPHSHPTRQVPIYFSGGMASRANLYYRLLVNWTNEQVGYIYQRMSVTPWLVDV